MRFEWNPSKNDDNLRKHGIDFEDAITVFGDPDRLEAFDINHSDFEDRWRVIGRPDLSDVELILLVVYTEREPDAVRIISARRADSNDVRNYRSRLPRIR